MAGPLPHPHQYPAHGYSYYPPQQPQQSNAGWMVAAGATLAFAALVGLAALVSLAQPTTSTISPYMLVAQDMRALGVSIPGTDGSEADLVGAVDGICAWSGTRTDLVKVARREGMSTPETRGLIDSSVRHVCPTKVFALR